MLTDQEIAAIAARLEALDEKLSTMITSIAETTIVAQSAGR
jgi:hypothetical protein